MSPLVEWLLFLLCFLWLAVLSFLFVWKNGSSPLANEIKGNTQLKSAVEREDNSQLPAAADVYSTSAPENTDAEPPPEELNIKQAQDTPQPENPQVQPTPQQPPQGGFPQASPSQSQPPQSQSSPATPTQPTSLQTSIQDTNLSPMHALIFRRMHSLHDSLDPLSFRPRYNLTQEAHSDLQPLSQPPIFNYSSFEDYPELQKLFRSHATNSADLAWKTGYLDLKTEASLLGMYSSWTFIQKRKCMEMSGVKEWEKGPTVMTKEHAFYDGLFREIETDVAEVYGDEKELDRVFGKSEQERARMWEEMVRELKLFKERRER